MDRSFPLRQKSKVKAVLSNVGVEFPFTHLDIKTSTALTSRAVDPTDLKSWWWTGWWQGGRSPWLCLRAGWRSTSSLGRGLWTCGWSRCPTSLPSHSGWRGPARGQKSSLPCRRSRKEGNEYSDSVRWYSALSSPRPGRICIHSMKTFYVGGIQVARQSWNIYCTHSVEVYYPTHGAES